jgi:hypothetical protein
LFGLVLDSVIVNSNIVIYKIVLLDFVHSLNYKIIKVQRFGSWILLPSSGKKGGRRHGVGLRLAEPRGPTVRLSVLFPPFLPEDRSRIQLQTL